MTCAHTRFRDRPQAGRLLAARLSAMALPSPAVFALPRGGLPIGWEIARALHAPLDVILVRKIGAPGEPEFALGAASEGGAPALVINEDASRTARAGDAYLARAAQDAMAEIARRRHALLAGRARVDPVGRTAIVADDGLATGATARAALTCLRQRGAGSIILAVPVASPEALETLHGLADRIVCLAAPTDFRSVGAFYDDFHQLTDRQARHFLGEDA